MHYILFVDDESIVLQVLQKLLSDESHRWTPLFATSGQKALKILESRAVDLLVTDMGMKHMNGGELLAKAKKIKPNMPRISLSGCTETDLKVKAANLAHVQVAKPYRIQELKDAIEKCLTLKTAVEPLSIEARREVDMERLPSPPYIYQQLVAVLQDADVSPDRIGDIICQDPAMGTKIIQLVNTPYFGVEWKINCLEDAISQIGYDTLKALVLSEEIFSQFEAGSAAEKLLGELQNEAFETAIIARAFSICEDGCGRRSNLAYVCGLLSNIGKIIMLANETASYMEFAFTGQELNESELEGAEVARFGMSHSDLGASLLTLWGFDQDVITSVRNHSKPNKPDHDEIGIDAMCRCAEIVTSEGENWRAAIDWSEFSEIGISLATMEKWIEFLNPSKAA